MTFFDNSFNDSIHLTRRFFLNYLEIIEEFCKNNTAVHVFLKPKNNKARVFESLGDKIGQYKEIWNKLINRSNFIYLDPIEFGFEESLAVSDVCISMGLNSPSTVALICGKNALYFDDTGNKYHPFAKKYENIIVFEDKDRMFRQLNNILNGQFNCRDVLSDEIIREYDAFNDENALERLRGHLYELTKDTV